MKSILIKHNGGAEIRGISIPEEIYWVLEKPAPLAGMRLPSPKFDAWETLHGLGFRWITCLCSENPCYDPTPLETLVAVELTDLVERPIPDDPDLEEKAIRVIARKILEKLRKGEGVIVHCAGGRGRTGTVLGVALRELGFKAEEIVTYLDQIHRARGKPGWPEAKWQGDVVNQTS